MAIHELEKSGECRPDEVKKRTQYFDRRVQDFIKRVNERRRILEKAVSFYSQTQTVRFFNNNIWHLHSLSIDESQSNVLEIRVS